MGIEQLIFRVIPGPRTQFNGDGASGPGDCIPSISGRQRNTVGECGPLSRINKASCHGAGKSCASEDRL